MSTPPSGKQPAARGIKADPRDTGKTASRFFAEMPWDGLRGLDLHEWKASRFFELFREHDAPVNE